MNDLLIPGSGMFVEYITRRMKEKFEVDRYEENEATYLGMEIMTVGGEDFEGVVLIRKIRN